MIRWPAWTPAGETGSKRPWTTSSEQGGKVSDSTMNERGPRIRRIPPGDDRDRLICPDCSYVAYENPKVVVGAVCHWGDRILLCRRAIAPRSGYWTLPAGYLELGESAEAGARREAWEEARAELELESLLAVYSITRISQIQLIYRARLCSDDIAAGPESAEVALFTWSAIPWATLAFPSVRWALAQYRESLEDGIVAARTNPEPEQPLPGEGPC